MEPNRNRIVKNFNIFGKKIYKTVNYKETNTESLPDSKQKEV